MASNAFDFSDLFRQIENEIDDLMGEPSSKETLKMSAVMMVQKNVYPFYGTAEATDEEKSRNPSTSQKYIRRRSAGGLADTENYEVEKDRLKLTITNNTPGNGNQPGESWTSGPINDIIESGHGYGWRHSQIYLDQPPRPFMQDAVDYFVDDYLLPMIRAKCFTKVGGS